MQPLGGLAQARRGGGQDGKELTPLIWNPKSGLSLYLGWSCKAGDLKVQLQTFFFVSDIIIIIIILGLLSLLSFMEEPLSG